MSTSLYRNCSATDGPAKELARFVETKLRASWANPLRCRFIARRQPGKLFRAALRVQADDSHGPAKLLHRRCAICLSWPSRPLRGLRAGRSTRGPPRAQARRSDDSRTLSQKLELTSGGIDSGLIPMLSIDDVSQ